MKLEARANLYLNADKKILKIIVSHFCITCGLYKLFFTFQAIQTTMHQGAKDNITQLDAKTNYGRPKWDDIFRGIAQEHSG